MRLLSVGLKGTTELLKERLQQDCNMLAQEGFYITVDECNRGKYTFLGCNLSEGELSYRNYERLKAILRKNVVKLLADFIIIREEKRFIRKIIDNKYAFFDNQDKEKVFNYALKLLNSHNLCGDFDLTTRRNGVMTRLQEYLDCQYELVVEGFINFRLKDYCQKLRQIVDRAVDEYMMDLEYQEFIKLLKYFVEEQETKVDNLHIIVDSKGNFHIFDEYGHIVRDSSVDSFLIECGDGINYDDMLISALVTIAPQNITIHNPWNVDAREVLKIINEVFAANKLIFCYGCEMCLDKH